VSDLNKQELSKAFNDRSRKITLRGKSAVVPLKFDRKGQPVTESTNLRDLILKRLTLTDIEFLYHWRANEFKDANKACTEAGISLDHAERLAKKLSCFREEDAKVRALAEIPTPTWIAAKHVENVYDKGSLEDSERDSLKELAKISGAYKTQASVTFTQNVFNLPKLSPEAEAKLKEIADREADIVDAQVSNG
jgi:hypothetical protein